MQSFFQSAFLQSLGYAIANSLWQAALLWLVYMSISNIRLLSAALKYRLAVAAQVIGFGWFLVTFQFYYTQYSHALKVVPTVPQQNIQAILSSNTDISSRVINWMVKGEQLLPYVSMAYLLLMVFLCVRWMLGYRQTQLLRSNGLQKMPAEWRLFVTRIAQQLNIKKKVEIFLSATVQSPLTIGFLKPVILIPVASINHLTTDQLEAVLLHELAHIKRYDYLVNIVLSVVEISLFFNPFTQLLSKSIRKERENSCDDWVLQFQYDASVYAQALLRIACLQSAPAFAMAATGKKGELLTRVKRMIGEKENRFNYKKQLLAFLIVTGILSSIAWLNPHSQQNNKPVAGNAKTKNAAYAVEPMAVTVDNPLFNPVFFLSKPLKEEMEKNIASAQKELGESLYDLREPMSTIASVSPLVANAMQEASFAMDHATMDKEASDSVFFVPGFKKQWHADMGRSVKEMEDGLKQAKAEIARNFKMSADLNLESTRLGTDLMNVVNELSVLGKTGVDKMVINSLNLSSEVLKALAAPKGNTRVKPQQKENTKARLRKQQQAAEDKAEEEEAQPEKEEDHKTGIELNDHASLMFPAFPDLAVLEQMAQVKMDEATIAKIRTVLLKLAHQNEAKIVPLLNREKVEAGKKIVVWEQ